MKPTGTKLRRRANAAVAIALASIASTIGLGKPFSESVSRVAESKEVSEPLGVVLLNIYDFEGEQVAEARAALKLSDRLQVYSVEEESIADQLGIEPGDVLMEINGIYVPKGKEAETVLNERVYSKIDWSKPIVATVLRKGFGLSLEMADAGSVASAKGNKEELPAVKM